MLAHSAKNLQDAGKVLMSRKWWLLEVASFFQMTENLNQRQLLSDCTPAN